MLQGQSTSLTNTRLHNGFLRGEGWWAVVPIPSVALRPPRPFRRGGSAKLHTGQCRGNVRFSHGGEGVDGG